LNPHRVFAQQGEPPWDAEPRFELGPALQQAHYIITSTNLWRLQVGFWPCNPNVPDLPSGRQRAAAIWTGSGDNIYIKAGNFSKILP